MPRVELQVVRQRSRGALHHAGRQAVQLAGPHARRRRAHECLGRQSYRFSDQDLHGKSFDGYGEDWPISYKDLVPYYGLVEDYVGISGQAENVPELPDSHFHPAMPMSCAETQLRTRVKSKLGWTVTIGRAANITRPHNGRGACHYCGPCEHGCVTKSYLNAAFTTVADAVKSGNTTLITDAMVYKVLTDPSTRRATGSCTSTA